MRAAIYVRISKDRAGAGLGVERQLQDCRALAERLGWTVVVEHDTDNDTSAYSGKPRKGYKALLEDIRGGRVDAVLVWHTDRLHRSPVELEAYISACELHGVPTHTVKAGPLDLATPSGRMVARQLGAVARYEVEHMVERQVAAKEQAAQAGRYRGGRRPFGYDTDGTTVRLDEAAVVRDCAKRLLAGETLASLARSLNDQHITTSAGNPWTPVSLRLMLSRARNFAMIERKGQILEGVQAQWPPILDEDVGRAIRTLMADPNRRRPKSADRVWLGAGLFLCGVCADGTTVRSAGAASAAVYRCRSHGHLSRLARPVDELVTDVILAVLSRPDTKLLLRRDDREDPAELHTRMAALRQRLNDAATLFAEGTITAVQLATVTGKIRTDLADLEHRAAVAVADSPLAGFADAADVHQAWQAATVSRRKVVVDALMTVTLLPAPLGRRPDGGYFDPTAVRIEPRSHG